MRVERLLGGVVRLISIGRSRGTFDPHPALAELRLANHSIVVAASGGLRAIAQRILGGADELGAPRPPTLAEHAIWSLLLAALTADAGIAGEVWPLEGSARERHERALALAAVDRSLIGHGGLVDEPTVAGTPRAPPPRLEAQPIIDPIGIELALEIAGRSLTVVAWCPAELVMRVPVARPVPNWTFALPIVVARCLLSKDAISRLAVRDVIVVERDVSLIVGDGGFPLTATPGAVEARVATGYVGTVASDVEAGLPVTVQLGTTRLTLRRLGELAVGEILGLDRPLAGPYEIHAGGRLIGHGELVDLEGEIGVRIVSLSQE